MVITWRDQYLAQRPRKLLCETLRYFFHCPHDAHHCKRFSFAIISLRTSRYTLQGHSESPETHFWLCFLTLTPLLKADATPQSSQECLSSFSTPNTSMSLRHDIPLRRWQFCQGKHPFAREEGSLCPSFRVLRPSHSAEPHRFSRTLSARFNQ